MQWIFAPSVQAVRSQLTLAVYSEDENKSKKSDTECLEPSPAKTQCSSSIVQEKRWSKYQLPTSNQKHKEWEESLTWLTYDDNFQGTFCQVCRKREIISLQGTGGTWIYMPFKNRKREVEKMKAHAKSEVPILSCEAEKAAPRAIQDGPSFNNSNKLESKKR